MNKVLFGVAAAVACLLGVAAGESRAEVIIKKTTVVAAKPYYQTHGVKYSGGYYFAGRYHNHWAHRVWDAHYGRYHYYEPSLRVYFYYDTARGGYYPCH
jgi:hypothetical protein